MPSVGSMVNTCAVSCQNERNSLLNKSETEQVGVWSNFRRGDLLFHEKRRPKTWT
jgi:hypothetical protein